MQSSQRARELLICFDERKLPILYNVDSQEITQLLNDHPHVGAATHDKFALICGFAVKLLYRSANDASTVTGINPATCLAFHYDSCHLAIGSAQGIIGVFHVAKSALLVSVHPHWKSITNAHFANKNQLFSSSWDKTASIVTLDLRSPKVISTVVLRGHTNAVNDILPLRSMSRCVTCSLDKSLKVWDCDTGACIRTQGHNFSMNTLALHPREQVFASGAEEGLAIIWSCDTLEILRSMDFSAEVNSLAFDSTGVLYVGVLDVGVLSCNALTGDVGHVIIPVDGRVTSIINGTLFAHILVLCAVNIVLPRPQYPRPSLGLLPCTPYGPCQNKTTYTWLWRCCGRRVCRGDKCTCPTSSWSSY